MINRPFISPEDMPPTEATQIDRILRWQLERSTGRCFFEACDQMTRALLFSCQWYITTDDGVLTLVIDCPDIVTYWHIVSNIPAIGNRLERFASNAKITVHPPFGKGAPIAVSVNEISAYRDWL